VLQVLHRLCLVSACTAQLLHVGLSVGHCSLPITYNNFISPKVLNANQSHTLIANQSGNLCFAPASNVTALKKVLLVSKALLSLTARAAACLEQQRCLPVCADLVADSTLTSWTIGEVIFTTLVLCLIGQRMVGLRKRCESTAPPRAPLTQTDTTVFYYSSLTHRQPTPACLPKSCSPSGSPSGMYSATCTLATSTLSLAAIARSGGLVISAQTVFHMFGRPL